MTSGLTEEMSSSLQRGLTEWWNEETDYIFQRIERWAAIARGYNRLRSQRLSRGRLTMHEEQESRWSISSNKIVIEDPNWCPRFHNLRRSHRRKSRNDENCRINCCGTFNYQSAGNVDSRCLEGYRYDHSIYFKTIGDIKSSKREVSRNDDENDEDSSFYEENSIALRAKYQNDLFTDHWINDKDQENIEKSEDRWNDKYVANNDVPHDGSTDISLGQSFTRKTDDRENDRTGRNFWPIVDLKKLSLDADDDENRSTCGVEIEIDDAKISINHFQTLNEDNSNNGNNNNNDNNNNDDVCCEDDNDSTEKMMKLQIDQLSNNHHQPDSTLESSTVNSTIRQKTNDGLTSITTVRKSRKNPRNICQSVVNGDNNILWPGGSLNYTTNMNKIDNTALSPHHFRAVKVT